MGRMVERPWVSLSSRVLPTRSTKRLGSGPTAEDRALDLSYRLGDGDAAWARLRAVVGGAAAPHAVHVVHDVEPRGGPVVTRVEDEPVRVDDRGRPHVAAVGPEHGAGGGAGRAQDALGR